MGFQSRRKLSFRRIVKYGFLLIVAYISYEYFSLPSASIRELLTTNPEMTAVMKQRWNESDGDLKIKHTWVPLKKISRNMINAALAAEDGRFFSHPGIDWRALERAYQRNRHAGKVRLGGSTITMQLAKNLYFSTERSFIRKAKEAILALRLEKELPKKRILEIYLNIIELGNGIFGVEAASQSYYHKPASTLTKDEAARLAAIIPSPRKHHPFDQTNFTSKRASIIRRKIGG